MLCGRVYYNIDYRLIDIPQGRSFFPGWALSMTGFIAMCWSFTILIMVKMQLMTKLGPINESWRKTCCESVCYSPPKKSSCHCSQSDGHNGCCLSGPVLNYLLTFNFPINQARDSDWKGPSGGAASHSPTHSKEEVPVMDRKRGREEAPLRTEASWLS